MAEPVKVKEEQKNATLLPKEDAPGPPPNLPKLLDMTMENITGNTKLINSLNPNPRLKFLLESLVQHLHDFARETALTTEEWMTAIQFLTEVGQICSPTRQEFILLSDTLGLSTLVDAINHPKPPGATENTVLGPFFTEDAHHFSHGESIASPGKGEMTLVTGRLTSLDGTPIADATVDVWETDESGHYDTQYPGRDHPDCRGIIHTDTDGIFHFKCVKPVSYPIPHDGPVGKMLKVLQRHPYRPAHLHYKIQKDGFDTLVTALYMRGDPYEESDAVFGVKSSLIVDVNKIEDEERAKKYGMDVNDWWIDRDFVLVPIETAEKIRKENVEKAMANLKI
ncbi:aromatic compound dioxygenase [Saitoella complicata NRRL Y-17804]|nr:aromatic compound dioxygenase [Saitoella complicata NRRL Y-17804]ODQ52883.1 aromatic compound dioxygenase [Saitoella complicata NRRL Y-17804]